MIPTPITDAVLFANVGPSIYWTPEQSDRAMSNLRAAAAERGLSVAQFIEAVAPRPKLRDFT